ncbi:MAG: beta-lactamase family protein [Phycisphaerales bacterium]|nr:MAG: beta-lactamase family protein [Phycisphaerales bacterium]
MVRIRNITLLSALTACLLTGCQQQTAWFGDKETARIDTLVREQIDKGSFPGAVILIGQGDKILYEEAFGHQVTEPFRRPMRKDTIFDTASLAKPIATAAAVMILVDRGRLKLDDRVATYLPAFACEGKQEARIEHLLTHASGLPAYTNAKQLQGRFGSPCPNAVIEKICTLKALSTPGEEFRYSCLGYITLSRIVEAVSGRTFDDFAGDNIFRPLKMRRTTYNPPQAWQVNIAATEVVDGRPLRGTVHDPLAGLMGGVSGNAGLFSNARDLSVYCRMLLGGGKLKGKRILDRKTVAMMTTVQSHGRAYGFDVESSYSWIKGDYAPEGAFCHSGYTGTSIVCDPASGIYIIILTNRAHPHDKGKTKAIRKGIADIVFQAAAGSVAQTAQ